MAVQLSICIPTYNREKYLKEAVESIINQIDDTIKDEIEICISDNASTDNTSALVESFKEKFSNITYFRQEQNMGADNNYLKVIEIAHGKYCWFLGSDDIILPNSIKKILFEIHNETASIYSLKSIIYDKNLKFHRKSFHNFNDIVYYNSFTCIKKNGTNFGYISSIIVKKNLWDKFSTQKKFIGSAYAHVYVIFKILKEFNPPVKIIAQPVIGYRMENDSFLSDGRYNRIKIDVIGYNDIAEDVFGKKSKELIEINKTTVRIHVANHIFIAILANCATLKFREEVFKLCFKYYHSYIFFWIKIVPMLFIPHFVLAILRTIYRKTIKYLLIKQ